MKKSEDYLTLEEELVQLHQKANGAPISLGEILNTLAGKGQPLIILFLSLPFCQPIQIPGLSTPFGLIIAFFGLKFAFGKYAFLPKRMLAKTITPHALKTITEKVLWLLNKLKRFVHPRLSWLCHHPALQVINGLLIFLLGVMLALPLPTPFSNLLAAWSIFSMGLGLLEDDGVFVIISYFISAIASSVIVATFIFIKYIL